ncbi:uncharacterized protein MELLADRAFT_103932 [Melampsora larici-populina 98AG31]|uniref:Secreted protein n=1 Tax=Melampsora larici-populina (strain 98AG31 / pathotype 3-4-7) TaxID=747676 RepID=F4RD14_MELLP|nr:uncharacterized protein MELLADRAFT_103932 [Melampsora larici-populina 98AG31]EGG09821.1 hypothetical protein MELLADRAFT_103932 [Melampsora larici-populina 98AG31]
MRNKILMNAVILSLLFMCTLASVEEATTVVNSFLRHIRAKKSSEVAALLVDEPVIYLPEDGSSIDKEDFLEIVNWGRWERRQFNPFPSAEVDDEKIKFCGKEITLEVSNEDQPKIQLILFH